MDPKKSGRPLSGGPKSTITLSILDSDKYAVKEYALRRGMTVSELLHGWISAFCAPGTCQDCVHPCILAGEAMAPVSDDRLYAAGYVICHDHGIEGGMPDEQAD